MAWHVVCRHFLATLKINFGVEFEEFDRRFKGLVVDNVLSSHRERFPLLTAAEWYACHVTCHMSHVMCWAGICP